MSEEIYLEKKTGYAIMTINRPKQMNALNTGIVEQIDKLLDLRENYYHVTGRHPGYQKYPSAEEQKEE